jgi:hypothetical protein
MVRKLTYLPLQEKRFLNRNTVLEINTEGEMTKIILSSLTCRQTEDNTGDDEAELRIWADNHYISARKDMNNGETWNLGIPLEFNNRVKIQLWDLDNPGFPLYDDHDHLGTVTIDPTQNSGTGTFTDDGADYEIEWIPA